MIDTTSHTADRAQGDAYEPPQDRLPNCTTTSTTTVNPLPHSLRAELGSYADRMAAADRHAREATTQADRDVAEQQRREAMGRHYALEMDMADLFVLLLRHAIEHRPHEVRLLLADALRAELAPIIETIARLEGAPDDDARRGTGATEARAAGARPTRRQVQSRKSIILFW